MKKLRFLTNTNEIDYEKMALYITFSKIYYLKNKHKGNILYFFDIQHSINEENENSYIEEKLFEESKDVNKEYFPLSFKYIYKYYLTYIQFYNRIDSLLTTNTDIKTIEYSSNMSFVFKRAIKSLCKKYSATLKLNNDHFIGFSYNHNDEILSDIPADIESSNLFLYLYSKYLKLFNHKIFIFPSSFLLILPRSVNIFKVSVFNIFEKIKRFSGHNTSKKHSATVAKNRIICFSSSIDTKYKLNRSIWKEYRDDQVDLIEHIINVFFNSFPPKYLHKLKYKLKKLLEWSNTKCIILDETVDAFRRLVSLTCEECGVNVEFMPHGIFSEDLQYFTNFTISF